MLKGKFLTFIFEKSSRVDTKIQIPDTGTGTSPVLCPARPDFRSPQRIRKFRIMGYLWIWIQVEPKMLIRSRSSFEGPASGSSKDEKEQIKKQIL